MPRVHHNSRGSVYAETAVVLVFLLTLVAGVSNVGGAVVTQSKISEGARAVLRDATRRLPAATPGTVLFDSLNSSAVEPNLLSRYQGYFTELGLPPESVRIQITEESPLAVPPRVMAVGTTNFAVRRMTIRVFQPPSATSPSSQLTMPRFTCRRFNPNDPEGCLE